jgi:hypothetical protein
MKNRADNALKYQNALSTIWISEQISSAESRPGDAIFPPPEQQQAFIAFCTQLQEGANLRLSTAYATEGCPEKRAIWAVSDAPGSLRRQTGKSCKHIKTAIEPPICNRLRPKSCSVILRQVALPG